MSWPSEEAFKRLIQDVEDLGVRVPEDMHQSLACNELSIGFANFVASMTGEIGSLLGTEEYVNPIETCESLSAWKMELSSFLNELRCPTQCLYEADLANRFQSSHQKYLLVDYLCSEVAATRIEKYQTWASRAESQLNGLKSLAENLGIPLSTCTDPIKTVSKVIDALHKLPNPQRNRLIDEPLFSGQLSTSSQIKNFDQVCSNLSQEFELRGTMMMTRLNTTLLSFSWSDKIDGKIPDHVAKIISRVTSVLPNSKLQLGLSDVLAARKELTFLTKVSPNLPKCRKVTQVRIGSVPDRGGRTDEQPAPPPEMPPFQKRSSLPNIPFSSSTPGSPATNSNYFKKSFNHAKRKSLNN